MCGSCGTTMSQDRSFRQSPWKAMKPPLLTDAAVPAVFTFTVFGATGRLRQEVISPDGQYILEIGADAPVVTNPFNVAVTPQPFAGTAVSANMQRPLQDDDQRVVDVLNRTRFPGSNRLNIAKAARELEIPRKTLEYRIKKMGIK